MGLEGANVPLRRIPAMVIRGYKLVGKFSRVCHQFLVLCTCFIVQDLEIDMLILLFEALHDFVVGQHAMAISSGFEGRLMPPYGKSLH